MMLQTEIKSQVDEDVCVLVKALHQKLHYLFDCGFASSLSIRDCKNVKALFISHTHIDHFCNFDAILRHQLPVAREVIVCGPAGLAKNIQSKLRAYNWDLLVVDDKAVSYQVRELHPDGLMKHYRLEAPKWNIRFLKQNQEVFMYQDEVVKVKSTLLDHNIPTVAYRMEDKKRIGIKAFPFQAGSWINELKDAFVQKEPERPIVVESKKYKAAELFQYLEEKEGSSLAFVMDHQASESNHQKIIELCQRVKELYIECYYKHQEKDLAWKNHHSTAVASGQVARKAQVQKVIPLHFSRRYDLADIEEMKKECLDSFEGKEKAF